MHTYPDNPHIPHTIEVYSPAPKYVDKCDICNVCYSICSVLTAKHFRALLLLTTS